MAWKCKMCHDTGNITRVVRVRGYMAKKKQGKYRSRVRGYKKVINVRCPQCTVIDDGGR